VITFKKRIVDIYEQVSMSMMEDDYLAYLAKKRQLDEIARNKITAGSSLASLPRLLPKTGTPISERISTRVHPKIETDLPDKNIFVLA
jgi:hypothetical protein